MRVAVVGLGYVGAVTSVCLARDGHSVLGVDLERAKLELLRAGKPPIIEDGLQAVTESAANSGNLELIDSVNTRVAECEIIFICVGTPSASNGAQSLVAVERVTEQLGTALRGMRHKPLIVLRSTVPPGTTESLVTPLLERISGMRNGHEFALCFQPEFLREGTSVKDFYNPPFTIVGSRFPESLAPLRQLSANLPGEFVVTDTQSAEMVKLACNAFHALKVTFANEIGRLGRSLSLDARTVMKLLCMDTSLNISSAYLRPGFAYGGSCLPKDLRALLHLAKHNDVELPMLRGVAESNDRHIDHAATLIKEHGSRKIGFVGLSFKPGTDDLRESPLVTLAEHLIGKGYDLRVYDPSVSLARLIGANRRFIEQTIPHIASLMCESTAELLAHADVLLVGYVSPEVTRALVGFDKPNALIVDLAGIDARPAGDVRYSGVCW